MRRDMGTPEPDNGRDREDDETQRSTEEISEEERDRRSEELGPATES
jgi:hypothetical protein